MRRFVLLPSAVAGVAFALSSPAARGDVSKDACVDANASAQKLREAGRFAAAREKLAMCDDPSCPGIVRSDCERRMDELERAQPTLVLDVKDAAGNDVVDVRITMDSRPLTSRLTGAALRVDPGPHSFAFDADAKTPVTRSFLIKEGEKDRHERIVLADARVPATVPAVSPASPATTEASAARSESAPEGAPPRGGMGTRRVVGLVTGGVGVAGLAAGGVFGLLTLSAIDAQKRDCPSATQCPSYAQGQSDHGAASTDGTIATAAFIAGGVLLAAGAMLYFTGMSSPPSGATGLVGVAPVVEPGGGGLGVRARF